MKCKRSSDARAHDHHTLQVMRQQAVKAARHGEAADSVSKATGVNIRTVFRWLADFSMGGQSALLAVLTMAAYNLTRMRTLGQLRPQTAH